MLTNTYNEILSNLRAKYKKQTLTVKETASEMGISVSTLKKGMATGLNIPSYKVVGGNVRKMVVFPINNIARFLASSEQIY